MARVLTIRESRVSPLERDRYLAAARERQARFARAKCNFWVFEDVSMAGALVEFVEARDAEALSAALARDAAADAAAPRLYREVELG